MKHPEVENFIGGAFVAHPGESLDVVSPLDGSLEPLAGLIHEDNGKTLDEARAEITRAIEVTELACSLPQLVAGEALEVTRGVECRLERVPLGAVASVTPFKRRPVPSCRR
jgi:acyl-CoA reductase-like NAD-dependent aldehyde dehydrogenase